MLEAHGLRVTREGLATSSAEAVALAEAMGFPVVAKLSGESISHKTEIDGVRLGLGDAEAVRAAVEDLLAAGPGGAEILVAEQVRGRRELIAGVVEDPQFGPALMLGIGGVFAEALADVTFRLLPAEREQIEAMVEDLELAALLGPFRGEPAIDRVALADALESIAACAAAHPEITSIDVNPLIVVDGRPVAVDALVVLR